MCAVPRILGLVAALVLSTSLLSTGNAAAVDDPALTGAPGVGACYRLTAEQLGAPAIDQAPVDCATPHTTAVIAVDTLPGHLSWSTLTDELAATLATTCWSALLPTIGRNPLQLYRSQYSIAYFGPDATQQAAGARWVACHAIVVEDDGPAELPHPLPRVSRKLPDSIATCLTKQTAFTTCADAHAWRSSHAFYATGKATRKNAIAAAEHVCPRKVTTRAYYYTWQDVPGRQFVVGCYSKTRR